MAGRRWKKVFNQEYDPLQAGSIDGTDTEPHDRAIVRALNAKYKPNKSVVGDPDRTLFISRLNFITTQERLEKEFSSHGKIRRSRLVRDIVTGMSKGYAFIEYEEMSSATKAWHSMNRQIIDDKMIFVEFELERTLKDWVPRRLGGGIGGKKESGQLRFGGRDKPFHEPIVVQNFGRKIDISSGDRDSPDSRSYRSGYHSRGMENREHSSRYQKDSDSDRSRKSRRDRSRSRERERRKERRYRSRSRSADRSQKRRNDRSDSEERSNRRKGRY